jgi:hypothetical protein
MATTFPTVMVRTARTHRTRLQSGWSAGRAVIRMRRNAANAAAFVPAIMKAVTDVGAPS